MIFGLRCDVSVLVLCVLYTFIQCALCNGSSEEKSVQCSQSMPSIWLVFMSAHPVYREFMHSSIHFLEKHWAILYGKGIDKSVKHSMI